MSISRHSPSKIPRVLVVVGPTASGKSALAVMLAKKLNGEVVSADSRQVYRGLNIGSGKITTREMRGVPHHLLDVASPKRVFTIAQYVPRAERVIRDITRRGKLPIVCGGTAFYIDALLGIATIPPVPPDPKLRAELARLSTEALANRLEHLDPERAATIDRKNRVRLVRAIEIVTSTGKPIPHILATPSRYNALIIGITRPKEELRARIHARLTARLRAGMVREVEHLHASGVSWERLEALGLEYRFVSRYLRGNVSKEQMRADLEHAITQYAKRQMTWWKRNSAIRWTADPHHALDWARTWLTA